MDKGPNIILQQNLQSFRIIPQLDKDPDFVAYAQSIRGKILLFAAFIIFMIPNTPMSEWDLPVFPMPVPLVTMFCAIYAFAEKYRDKIFPVLTFFMLLLFPLWFNTDIPYIIAKKESLQDTNFLGLRYIVLCLFFTFAATMIFCTYRFRNILPFRRPIILLICLWFALVLIASCGSLHGFPQLLLWAFIEAFSCYFWFLGYALLDKDNKDRSSAWTQLGTLHPFFLAGTSRTPIGKGAANLRNFEKKTPHDIAVSQIKGVKLAAWCLLLRYVFIAYYYTIHVYWDIPTVADALAHQFAGTPYSLLQCWGSIISSFFQRILQWAIWFNLVVAYARMAGFQLLRGQYKPLYAKSLIEFWNRFNLYFRDLLVEFFFFPTFVRCFKKHPRLRIAFATFMAACVGNILYHFILTIFLVPQNGLLPTIIGLQTYTFHTMLLATGITISQLSGRSNLSVNWVYRTLFPFLRIALFFSLLEIFDNLDTEHSLWDHFKFFFRLLGLEFL